MNDNELPKAAKHVGLLFFLTLFAYVTIYGACEAHRRRNGAWHLTFTDTNGTPMLRIDHPHLISPEGVAILFPGEKATRSDLPITAVFNVPITNSMPFGPILFVDTTILPGTVALNAFGHGIQLLPRTLSIDFKEFSWETAAPIVLSATNKPPSERLKPHPQDWQGR